MNPPSPADLARRAAPRLPAQPTAKPAPKPEARKQEQPARRTAPTPPSEQPYVPRKLTVAEAIAPGKLTKQEHFRKYFLFGMRRSRMDPSTRLVGLDLLWRASHATGQMSASLQPTPEHLAQATGLTVGQVEVAIANLHSHGWIRYRRLQEGPRVGQEIFDLVIPAAALEDIRAVGRKHASNRVSR
ncbi:hypothetical protein [Streptomyces sp. NPDC000888]